MQQAALDARRRLLAKLPALYEEQHSLAMGVMGSLLPQPQQLADALPGALTSAEVKVASARAWGFGRAALRVNGTIVAMDALRTNVLRERSLQRQLAALLLHEVPPSPGRHVAAGACEVVSRAHAKCRAVAPSVVHAYRADLLPHARSLSHASDARFSTSTALVAFVLDQNGGVQTGARQHAGPQPDAGGAAAHPLR